MNNLPSLFICYLCLLPCICITVAGIVFKRDKDHVLVHLAELLGYINYNDNNYVARYCPSNSRLAPNSNSETYLDVLMDHLASESHQRGFGFSSMGQKMFGSTLCRGDVSNTECTSCVINAGREIRKRCPYKKEAVIWYEKCMLKYSDTNSFTELDERAHIVIPKKEGVVRVPVPVSEMTIQLLKRLAGEACRNKSTGLYAVGKTQIDGIGGSKQHVFGLAQCTGDLNEWKCKLCLANLIAMYPGCCAGTSTGAHFLSGSCVIRYDSYRFYHV